MLTAIILTHNDERTLGRTLASLAFADELVVIDDFSSDATPSIVKKHHAILYRNHLNGDFAAQRNFALTKAKGEWVLFIDSDEVISKKLADEIRKATQIDCAGFYLARQDWLFGKKLLHGETNRVRLLRLAKKDMGKWERPVHEVWEVKGLTGTLVTPLDHYPHPDVAQFIDDINRYSTLNAMYLCRQHVSVPWWHLIAYPAGKFFLDYVWYGGFLDGTAGAVVALMMSMHSFLTRAKLWLLIHHHEA